jgi:hypothetical protein
MESAFINEIQGGILTSWDGTKRAVAFLEYGQGEWWNSQKMVAHLEEVIKLAEEVFPWAQFVFRFDHSSNHTAMAEDALNAKRMNKNPGGKQPKMRRSKYVRGDQEHIQFMVDNKGKPKGLQKVLEERGLIENNSKLSKEDMVKLMEAQPDFRAQTTILHDVVKKAGHICRFYPKFHCELSPIEMFWNRQKNFVRRHCGYNIKTLRWTTRLGLEAVCCEEVRRFFGLCRRYEAAYRMQQEAQKLIPIPALVRVTGHSYKSHRKVSENALTNMDEGLDRDMVEELYKRASCTCVGCAGRSESDADCDSVFCRKHSTFITEDKKTAQEYYNSLSSNMKKVLTARRSFQVSNVGDDADDEAEAEEEEEEEDREELSSSDEAIDDFSSEEEKVEVGEEKEEEDEEQEEVVVVRQQRTKRRRIPKMRCADCDAIVSHCKCKVSS